MARRRKYGLARLILDLVLTCLSGGLWLIWIVICFLRNGHR